MVHPLLKKLWKLLLSGFSFAVLFSNKSLIFTVDVMTDDVLSSKPIKQSLGFPFAAKRHYLVACRLTRSDPKTAFRN